MFKKFLFLSALLISTHFFGQEKKFNEQQLSVKLQNIAINGTLLTPKLNTKNKLVILIPGSGPTDRDGNNTGMKNNSLKYLAESLAENNIATYRYDKSVLSFTKNDIAKIDSLTFENFIDEAKAVVNYFKNSSEYSKIIIAGHSQGSLVGMIAALNNADGFISLSGAGRSIDSILIEQIEKQAPFLKDETQRIVTELKKGNTVDEFNPMLVSLFNKSVQPFLISWIKYNPQNEIAKLKIPILIINGSKDIQVPVSDAELLHYANKNSEFHIIENMNHIFKEINGDTTENIQSYTNPNLPIMVNLTTIITNFVTSIN